MANNQDASLHVPVVQVNKPCEECGTIPALEYSLVGITGVLCRACLNTVVSQINTALAQTSQDASTETVGDTEQTDKPYTCAECGKHLAFTEMLYYGNLTYCFAHVPDYNKHQQW